ncbi:MAG: hypothetical protein AB9873_16925 [Syntrophobacteraceae bacterium]
MKKALVFLGASLLFLTGLGIVDSHAYRGSPGPGWVKSTACYQGWAGQKGRWCEGRFCRGCWRR